MPHFMEDPTFWVSLSFIILIALAIKPLYGKIVGALDAKIAEMSGMSRGRIKSVTRSK